MFFVYCTLARCTPAHGSVRNNLLPSGENRLNNTCPIYYRILFLPAVLSNAVIGSVDLRFVVRTIQNETVSIEILRTK